MKAELAAPAIEVHRERHNDDIHGLADGLVYARRLVSVAEELVFDLYLARQFADLLRQTEEDLGGGLMARVELGKRSSALEDVDYIH